MGYRRKQTWEHRLVLPEGGDWARLAAESHRAKPIDVAVVFTKIPATLCALRKAADLTRDLNARIRLLVPEVVPYPLPLDHPPAPVEFTERRFLATALAQTVETHVEVYLCRDIEALLWEELVPRSLVVIGGRKRWWPTRETRLAAKLRRRGHVVVFAALPRKSGRASGPASDSSGKDLEDAIALALDPRSPLGFLERLGLILWLEGAGRAGLWL